MLLLFFPPFWLVVALLIVGLVCGVRFSIRGAHPSNEKVNQYIHKAEDAASRVSQAWQENAPGCVERITAILSGQGADRGLGGAAHGGKNPDRRG